MRRLAVALFTASLGLGSASAADLPADVYGSPAYGPAFVAPVPVTYNWTGLYLGAHVGGAWGDSRWIFVPVSSFGVVFPGADLSGNEPERCLRRRSARLQLPAARQSVGSRLGAR